MCGRVRVAVRRLQGAMTQSYGGEVEAVWRSQDIGDVGTMRHLGRKAEDLEWNWPKREAMCAADSYLSPWGPADSIMSPYARHGAADLVFSLLGFCLALL